MPPPSSFLSTASSSTAGPSPAKRRKLAGPASARSSSRATSISSKSTLRPVSSSSSAATPFEDREHAEARRASVARVLSVWESLEQRYGRAMDDDDIVDLRSGKLVQDRGILKGSKSWQYGELLGGGDAEDKDDGATTEGSEGLLTTGNDDEEEEEEEGEEQQRDPDQSLDDLQLLGPTNEGDATSDDELGEWDTVPAPPSASPSPNGSPNQSRASSPGPAFLAESRPTTPGTLSTFLQANFRPKLEKLAKEREDSPLPPADDLQAFMAAEQSMKARTKPGYVEPEATTDDEEVIFLGYSTGQEDVGASDADGRGENGETADSEDELNDWDTVPAPPSDEENPAEEAEDQEEELLAPYDPLTESSSDSDPELPPLAQPSRSSSTKESRHPPKPPALNHSSAKPAKPSNYVDRALASSSEGSEPSPTKSKSNGSAKNNITGTPKKKKGSASSSTTLTPALNRLMRDSTAEVRHTPSRRLIPEVVIPVYRGTSSSPTKASQTAQPSPKKPTKASSKSVATKPRISFTPLSDSEDDAPLISRQTPKHPIKKTSGPKTTYIEIESDEEEPRTRRDAGRSTRDESGSSPSKPSRDKATSSKSRDTASPTKLSKRKEKERAETKKRKRDSVEEVQVETQFVERMGSLGLEDSEDDEVQEGDSRRRATAAWQRAVSGERPVRHSTPPRSVSPALPERYDAYQVEPAHDDFREYDRPAEPPSRADPVAQNPPQALPLAPPPPPQLPVPQLPQQALPTPQPMQAPGYPGFYYPPSFPYMQMQMPVQMQVPMAMPMPMTPQFYYPPPASPATLIPTPQVPVPQPQSPQPQQAATPNAGHEALLTQVLYTLNYLAHQNVASLPANQQQQQQQPAPAATPVAQRDSDGFAIPLPPETPQQDWR
ncbi:hypothetical protein FRC01_006431, partial [Tulasnella sp. 417]